MKIIVFANSCLLWKARFYPCVIGQKGLIEAENKLEGDLATPIGCWKIEQILYRKDRLGNLTSQLPISAIMPSEGWCDDSDHKNYNKKISFPFSASAEKLWREDSVYDIVFVLGYNRNPIYPKLGSAIFLHLANEKALSQRHIEKTQKLKPPFTSLDSKKPNFNLNGIEQIDINQYFDPIDKPVHASSYPEIVRHFWKPTEGCVAVSKSLALDLVNTLSIDSHIEIINQSSIEYLASHSNLLKI